jgi:trimethylamine--corrinoid protein Co-methyltransferase
MQVSFQVLSGTEREQIHAASLEVLSSVGMKIETKQMREALAKRGASVDEAAETVRFPEKLVEETIAENKRQVASGKKLHLMNGVTSEKSDRSGIQAKISGGCELFFDWEKNEIKPATAQALLSFIRLGEKIPEVDFVGNPIVMKEDLKGNKLEERMRRVKTAALIAKNTRKVGSMEVWDEREIDLFVEMGTVARGSREAFEDSPCLVTAKETISPFFLDKNAGDVLLGFAKRGLPCTIIPMPITGMSTPVTMAGNAVVGNAEILGVMAAVKAVYPEAVVGGGTISGIMDMQTSVASFSAPEAVLQDIAIAEVHEHLYGLNYLIGTGYTDAKYPNSQLLAEKTAKFLFTYLSGRYTYPIGLLNAGALFSAEQALVDLELCRYIHGHFENRFDFSALREIVQVIKDTGIRGNTIGEQHTFDHFRENWFPSIMDRTAFSTIEENSRQEIYRRAHEKAAQLLAGDDFWRIEPEKEKEIDAIVKKADQIL